MSDIQKIIDFLNDGRYLNQYQNQKNNNFGYYEKDHRYYYAICGYNNDYVGKRLPTGMKPSSFVKTKAAIKFDNYVKFVFKSKDFHWVHLKDETKSFYKIYANGVFYTKEINNLVDYHIKYLTIDTVNSNPKPNGYPRLFSCVEQKLMTGDKKGLGIYISSKPCDNCLEQLKHNRCYPIIKR